MCFYCFFTVVQDLYFFRGVVSPLSKPVNVLLSNSTSRDGDHLVCLSGRTAAEIYQSVSTKYADTLSQLTHSWYNPYSTALLGLGI